MAHGFVLKTGEGVYRQNMDVKIERRLLQYLQGKISFNEWLDGVSSAESRGQLAENLAIPTDQTVGISGVKMTNFSQSPSSQLPQGSTDEASSMQGISSIDDNFQGSGGVTQIIAADEDKQNDSGDYDYDDDNIDCDFEEDDNGDENFDDDETNDMNSSADLELGKSR